MNEELQNLKLQLEIELLREDITNRRLTRGVAIFGASIAGVTLALRVAGVF